MGATLEASERRVASIRLFIHRIRNLEGHVRIRRFLIALLCDSLPLAAAATPIEIRHPLIDFLRWLGGYMSGWDRRRLEHFRDLFAPARNRAGTRLRRQDGGFALYGSVEYFTWLLPRLPLAGELFLRY